MSQQISQDTPALIAQVMQNLTRNEHSRVLDKEEKVVFANKGEVTEGEVYSYNDSTMVYSCRIKGGHLVSVPNSRCFPYSEVMSALTSIIIASGISTENAPESSDATTSAPTPPETSKDATTDQPDVSIGELLRNHWRSLLALSLSVAIAVGIFVLVSGPGTEPAVTETGTGDTVQMQAAKRVNERNIRLMSPSPLPLEEACRERQNLLDQNKADVSIMFPNN